MANIERIVLKLRDGTAIRVCEDAIIQAIDSLSGIHSMVFLPSGSGYLILDDEVRETYMGQEL